VTAAWKRTAFSITWVVLAAFGVPLGARFLLGAAVGLPATLVPITVTTAVGIAAHLHGKRFLVLRIASLAALLLYALTMLAGILITPLSAYTVWFNSVRAGDPKGLAANVFVLVISFFSSALSLTALSSSPAWMLLALGLLLSCLATIIYQSALFFVLSVGLGLTCVLFLALARGPRSHRLSGALFPVTLLGISLLLAWVASRGREPKGNRLVDESLYPGLRAAVFELFPQFPLAYEIPGYGYTLGTERLGGPAALSTVPMFDVQAQPGRTLYLRALVFDYYDGKSWKSSAVVGPKDANAVMAAADTVRLGGAGLSAGANIRITQRIESFPNLLHPLEAAAILLPESPPREVEGNLDSGFTVSSPIASGDTYAIRSVRREDGVLAGQTVPAVPELSAVQRERYFQLPKELPSEVKELAISFADDSSDLELALSRIEQYLAFNQAYNLRVSGLARDTDFVDSFLFKSRSGYCVHFATTFVILARALGIPARYVTGYLVNLPQDKSRTIVSGMNSHAWAEVWIAGRGWVSWEATTALNPAYYALGGEGWFYQFRVARNRATSRQLEQILHRRVLGMETREGMGETRSPLRLLVGLAALPAALLLLLLARFGARLVLHARDGQARFAFTAKKLVLFLGRHGVPHPEVIGWVRWSALAAARLPDLSEAFQQALPAILGIEYGGVPADLRSLEPLSRLVRSLRRPALKVRNAQSSPPIPEQHRHW
jgi:hypothetical protein